MNRSMEPALAQWTMYGLCATFLEPEQLGVVEVELHCAHSATPMASLTWMSIGGHRGALSGRDHVDPGIERFGQELFGDLHRLASPTDFGTGAES